MREIFKKEIAMPDELALVGGTEDTWKILSHEWGVNNFLTVQEMAGLFPTFVPLSHKSDYPDLGTVEVLKDRVLKRFNVPSVEHIMNSKRFKSIMVFSNPYLYETHMQIMSDVLISKEGRMGTVRSTNDLQYPSLYYA
jgi:hypothetical protein